MQLGTMEKKVDYWLKPPYVSPFRREVTLVWGASVARKVVTTWEVDLESRNLSRKNGPQISGFSDDLDWSIHGINDVP